MDDKRSRFEAQVLPHLDAAYRLARWLSRAPGDADDIVQEAFLRAFRSFDTLRSPDARAWVLAIVRNCHLSALQHGRRRAAEPLDEEHETDAGAGDVPAAADPEAASIERDERRALARLIGALPGEHREVLVLRELEDMSYREIAAVTAVPIGTVMSRLARARAALRAKWHEESEGDGRAVR
ncbi:MAG TPA: sigma-70 family RNA polymerase sigma factor [Steroidobacteraceae bacterium]|nr:sigma-70 family RNA polymerase sigma factor [Gammaproteobacteria bacterium]HEV2285822.1 sigma-70 family RNA polymerase sigma factor [Steroidobacteraceae bacterium]